MEWIKEVIREALQSIRFSECIKATSPDKVGKEQWHLFNVETIPSMDYKQISFDLVINFGTLERYKSLYTPEFTKTLETCLAPISEQLTEPYAGLLVKKMTVTIKRGTL